MSKKLDAIVLMILCTLHTGCSSQNETQSESNIGFVNVSFESNKSTTIWQEVDGWEGKTGEEKSRLAVDATSFIKK